MIRQQYKEAHAELLTDYVTEQMTNVRVVQPDSFFNRSARLDKLDQRLPGIFTRYVSGEGDHTSVAEGKTWVTHYNLVYFDKIDPSDPYKFERALDELCSLFDQDDYPLPGFAEEGVVVHHCTVVSDGIFDDLTDQEIGGIFVTIEIAYTVFPTPAS